MTEKKPFLQAAGLVGGIIAISRLLGLVRDMVLASVFGASRFADVFLIAFELPNLTRRILGEGSLSAFIVPIFSRVRAEEGEERGWKFASNALTTIGLASLVLTALGMLFARPLFSIFGYGYVERGDVEAILLGARLTRIMFPFQALLAVGAILMGLCHSVRHFTMPSLGSVMLNVTMIACAFLFGRSPEKRVFAQYLAISVVLGALLRLAIMIPPLARRGFRYRPRFKPDSRHMRELYLMIVPALFGLAVVEVNISISRIFATLLGEGFVPCLMFSNHLVQLPLAIVGSALATAILPQISQYWVENRREDLRSLASFALRINYIFFMPAAVGLIALGQPIIEVLFERHAWNAEATARAYKALVFYAPGLVAWGTMQILTPIYYAQRDVRTPVKIAAAATVFNIALNLLLLFTPFLRATLGHGGLALATTLGVVLNATLQRLILRRRGLDIWDRTLTATLFKTFAAACAMGAAGWGAWRLIGPLSAGHSFLLRAFALLAVIGFSAGVYFLAAYLLHVSDLRKALAIMMKRRRREF